MSDPRNVAHAKKVTQEKKHQGTEARPDDTPAAQPGKKAAVAKKKRGSRGIYNRSARGQLHVRRNVCCRVTVV